MQALNSEAMKIVAVLVIIVAAAFVGWQAYWSLSGTPCPGGAEVASEQRCREIAGFDAAFCRAAFVAAEDAARRGGPVFTNQADCVVAGHPVCMASDAARSASVPRPSSYCVVRGADGAARVTPLFSPVAR
jgi:uncharacterized protein YgiB involved in biofilm formation